MGTSDLFNGVAIIIDDEIGDRTANITKLMNEIRKRNMPCVIYKTLPDPKAIQHFHNISFLLLDWRLKPKETTKGASTFERFAIKENIDFLNKLKSTCFAPIFIFTDEEKQVVIDELKTNNLYQDGNPSSNYIFVKKKDELIGPKKLFKEIEKWVKKVPSIYVLKEWEREYRSAKNNLFLEFYTQSPSWPKILWETFKIDGVNSSYELGEIITRNLYTRMAPYAFDDKTINRGKHKISRKEIRQVLEGARFMKRKGLHNDSISSGDVFKVGGQIYLNIRPDCDCIRDRSSANSTLDTVQLYLLKGSKLSENKERKIYDKTYKHFKEIDSQAIVFSMLDGVTFDFRFKDLTLRPWSELKDKRIGRILPPYITRIQQRYAMYLQRQGLPAIPGRAIFEKIKSSSGVKGR